MCAIFMCPVFLAHPPVVPAEFPAWWAVGSAAPAAAALAFLAVASAAWVVTLRARVRRQTEQIRRQLEHEAELEARFRDLFDNARDGIWITDPDGLITALNRVGEKLLGLPAKEAVGRPIAEFIPPEDIGKARASRIATIGLPFELTILPRGGSPTPVEVTSRVQPDGGVQTIARSVADRKAIQERVQRAQKLEAVGRLAGGIAHDFNNLLTVINGSAELLLADGGASAPLARDILAAGNRAAELTRHLLAFSRPRFVAPIALDTNAVVAASLVLLRRVTGAHVELVYKPDPNTPRVRGETGIIDQILMNLVLNARDAMPDGGRVTVRTSAAPNGFARIAVSDTGCGMDANTQAKIFEPFFTTKPVGQGVGLGLATVFGLVQSLGGAIRFGSWVGEGTTFEVDLPPPGPGDGPPVKSASAVIAAPPPRRQLAGKTVLLVDDDPPVRMLVRNVLEGDGATVYSAEDGQAALDFCVAHAGPLDLVLTDVIMPRLTGRALADRLRETRPGLQVVFMSAYSGSEFPGADERDDEWVLLPKPFTTEALLAVVNDALQKNSVGKLG
ncbi:hybrid sensor histidine kinase/response regulator [Fimbriiglobus ruber]|uniref:histidine kinase n=1 Tax=Fimbriiglobus ruber TaxID=1908690 RepID=A0A225DGY5_9BACT|nr:ATP-binding protein [Fimbriiglobus ruber]OWK35655.1 sensory box histidine kinase/response regulator [Fimbriiglobus ruber]